MRILKHLSPCQILTEKIFSPDDLTKIEEKVLKAKCAEITIPGFRPGNAPLDKVRAILEPTPEWEKLVGIKLQEELIDNWSEKFQTELGEIAKIIDLKVIKQDPLTIQGEFEYFPRVKSDLLGDKYTNIKIKDIQPASEIKVTDADVENILSDLQKRRTALKPASQDPLDKERLAFVLIDNGDKKKEPEKDSLGGRDLFQWGIAQYGKEFDDYSKGMKEGEEKTIVLKNLKDPALEKLEKLIEIDKSKPEFKFNLKVEKIFTSEVPSLDDHFAKSLGHFHNITELKGSIKQGALLEKLQQEKNKRKDTFINNLIESIDLELPESIVKRSATSLKKDFEERLKQDLAARGQKYNQAESKEDQAKMDKIYEERAKRELKLERILEAIAQKEKIIPELTEIEEETQKILRTFASPVEAKKALGDPDKFSSRVTLALCFDKTIRYLEKVNHVCDDLDPEIARIEKELQESHEHHHEKH